MYKTDFYYFQLKTHTHTLLLLFLISISNAPFHPGLHARLKDSFSCSPPSWLHTEASPSSFLSALDKFSFREYTLFFSSSTQVLPSIQVVHLMTSALPCLANVNVVFKLQLKHLFLEAFQEPSAKLAAHSSYAGITNPTSRCHFSTLGLCCHL